MEDVRVCDLIPAVWSDYENHLRKSLDDAKARWERHLKDHFGLILASRVSTDDIDKYKQKRRAEGAKPASINRELSLLRRAYHLGMRSKPRKVTTVPPFDLLTEDNTRVGFIEHEDYEKLAEACGKVGLWMRAAFECAYTYGFRFGELFNLKVRQVDLLTRTIRLDPLTTKSKRGREAVMTERVYLLLQQCVAGKSSEAHVFTWPDGSPVRDIRRVWENVCVSAGVGHLCCPNCSDKEKKQTVTLHDDKCSKCGQTFIRRRQMYLGPIWHDLRRTGVRNMIRSGISRKVAMDISGHLTEAVFSRYDIVDASDIRDAARKMEQYQQTLDDKRKISGSLHQKQCRFGAEASK